MNCHSTRQVFAELLDARTPATAHLEARAHLAACPDCQREFAGLSQTIHSLDTLPTRPPTARLRKNFYAMLEEEKHSAASAQGAAERRFRSRQAFWWRWIVSPLAACLLLALGFVAGQRSGPTSAPAGNAQAETLALQQQLAQLQDQVARMGTLVSYSLLQQQQRPANDRLRGVLTSATREDPDDRSLHDLIGALAFDTSPNVRLRALEALFPHAEQDLVRAGVVASLGREQNPLVQVSMIDFLTAANDREAKPVLERISTSATADQTVREAARRALTHL